MRHGALALIVIVLCTASRAGDTADAAGGALLWRAVYDGGGTDDFANAISEDAGRVVVAGESVAPVNADFVVRAYEAATGRLLWARREDLGVWGQALDVVVKGIRAFIAGSAGTASNPDFLVRCYDARNGDILWEDRVDVGRHFDLANAIRVGSGRVFAVGDFVDPTGSASGMIIRAYDAVTGTVLWDDRRLGESSVGGQVRLITVAGNRVFVAGMAASATGWELVIRAYDGATGRALWEDHYANQGYGVANAIAVSGSRVFAAGADQQIVDDTTVVGASLVRAYDQATGVLLWQQHRSPAADGDYRAQAVAAAGGFVFAAGVFDDNVTGSQRLAVQAYDARTGALQWEDASSDGQAVAAIALGNRLAVVGFNRGYIVRMYDARTGTLVWQDRADEDQSSDLLAVATSGNRLFTAGAVFAGPDDHDLVVRTYRAR